MSSRGRLLQAQSIWEGGLALLQRTWVRRLLTGVAAAGCWVLLFGLPGSSFIPYRLDLDVYRLGAETFLRGGDLYGPLPRTEGGIDLPFTYPPFAAILFVPLALLPVWAATLLLTLATLACMWLVLRLVVRGSGWPTALLLPAFTLAITLGPVWETVTYGQVNALLMALVAVDVLAGRGRPWRGWLVGLAMAIKLTPAVFLAYFLVRRDWRALGQAVLSAVVWTGFGLVMAPRDSINYWTSVLFDPSRIGGLAYVSNQSINGALVRLTDGDGGGLTWFLLCAGLGLLCLAIVQRQLRVGLVTSALVTMGTYVLLASPVTWSHHWVWAAPALVVLVERWRATGATRFVVTALTGVAIFLTRVVWLMPHRDGAERRWAWWQHLVGNAQTLWGVALIVVLATRVGGRRRPVCSGEATKVRPVPADRRGPGLAARRPQPVEMSVCSLISFRCVPSSSMPTSWWAPSAPQPPAVRNERSASSAAGTQMVATS